jgi:hypothetical protein
MIPSGKNLVAITKINPITIIANCFPLIASV